MHDAQTTQEKWMFWWGKNSDQLMTRYVFSQEGERSETGNWESPRLGVSVAAQQTDNTGFYQRRKI